MSEADYAIVDLKQHPAFFDIVADRLWTAWWKPSGKTLGQVETALAEVVAARDFPFTLVATRGGHFLGTVTSIHHDIDARPDLGPCLAALWVEPEARGQGIAAGMADALLKRLEARGVGRVYLSAKPKMRLYYLLRGWTMIDSDIDADRQDVFIRLLPGRTIPSTEP